MSGTGQTRYRENVSATERTPVRGPFQLIVLVGSLGGLAAVSTILTTLPGEFPVPLLVVQHGPRSTDPHRLTRLLDNVTCLPVRTARPGLDIDAPGVTVIPGGVTATVDEAHRVCLIDGDGLAAGDSLLRSVAAAVGPAAIGVVLTGMLRDGAQGVRAIKRHGGRVLVQDPATARASGMPSSAIATGCVDLVLPIYRIAPALIALTMAPGAADLLIVPTPPWADLSA
jgi:two-component system chemotaxis response regulator CheB